MADNKKRTRAITVTGLIAAMLCVLSPIALPIGDVPVSIATMAICIAAAAAGSVKTAAAVLVYLILGSVGLPVFAGFTAGFGRVLGPTGGFLMGYIPLALIAGTAERKRGFVRSLIPMILGTAVMYACGTAWYCLWSSADVGTALAVCVIPFLPIDTVKLILAAFMTRKLK